KAQLPRNSPDDQALRIALEESIGRYRRQQEQDRDGEATRAEKRAGLRLIKDKGSTFLAALNALDDDSCLELSLDMNGGSLDDVVSQIAILTECAAQRANAIPETRGRTADGKSLGILVSELARIWEQVTKTPITVTFEETKFGTRAKGKGVGFI